MITSGQVVIDLQTTVKENNLDARATNIERNVKLEFGKALKLLYGYALVPCANKNRGVRLAVKGSGDYRSISQANHPDENDGSREEEPNLEEQDQDQLVQKYVVSAAERGWGWG
ncbi:hypothetical protein K503DRAFT_783234 [Rhizopogon vinicolor AM-OR11-026]|uniref:Uncharacterized protein n=1 Tax=Rhizopogon vinicolor AM-OR11-026 TaxID=1314800 RepID=A0A1B7MZI0_9AGAM|nr:hypothetical protein K503DRAFT_783234 [Rhizopogon vinicolor AM-OR11-026]